MNYLNKWLETIRVSWGKYTAYRLNFFLQMIGPSIVFFFIKYNLWNSIYSSNPQKMIGGYSNNEMLEYHAWSFLVVLLAQTSNSINISEDIRLGKISTYLIYPINFWEFHTASFISFQMLQFVVASITFCFLYFFDFITLINPFFVIQGLLFCQLIALFWFSVQYLAGILAFWLEETWILRVLFINIATFLSGSMIPLELFPTWLRSAINLTPFPYLTYYPIKIFMGQISLTPLLMAKMMIWVLIIAFLNSRIWKKGMRLYTAAGM